MKILVCINSVPDTTSKIKFTENQTALDKTGIQWVINPLDEFVLSKALQLKADGSTVTVINVGTNETESVIRKALAMGADDAVRINIEPKDSYVAAKEIASVVQSRGFDLILCGKESIDYNGAAVPGMLAQLLNLHFVNAAIGLEMKDGEANVVREIEGGKEILSVKLPLVVAGQKGIVSEKDVVIPNMRGIMSARTKPLEVIEPTSTEVKVESVSFDSVPPRASVKLVPADQLDELVRLLHEEARVI